MFWTKTELLSKKTKHFSFETKLSFEPSEFSHHERLISVKSVLVQGQGYFESHSLTLTLALKLSGIMVVPCAITLEPLDYEFSFESNESYDFKTSTEENVAYLTTEQLELRPLVKQLILAEVPFKVVAIDPSDYPRGKDWEVISEAKLASQQKTELDPRLAKLKEYQHQDD